MIAVGPSGPVMTARATVRTSPIRSAEYMTRPRRPSSRLLLRSAAHLQEGGAGEIAEQDAIGHPAPAPEGLGLPVGTVAELLVSGDDAAGIVGQPRAGR